MNADDVKLGMRVAVSCEVKEMRLVDDKKGGKEVVCSLRLLENEGRNVMLFLTPADFEPACVVLPPHPRWQDAQQKPDSLMTQREIAELFAVSKGAVSQWEKLGCPVIRMGKTTTRKKGTAPRYNLAEVEKWLKERNNKRIKK